MGGRGGGPGVDLTLDGAQVKVDNPRSFRLKVPAGPHTLGLAVVDRQRGAGVDEIYSDFRTNATFTTPGGVPTLVVTGPYDATGVGDTPSRRAIFNCKPASASAADETACARTILTTLARRAYRGPVSTAEVNTLVEFYRQGRQAGDFDTGIQQALARILVAPRFVYRIEEEPATVASGQVYRVSDVELASRLSFFLWSSIPDDELRDVAMKGRLRDPQTLAQQVKRMLADGKADAIVDNFAGQWLYLRELENVQTEAKSFDENLRRSFRRETEMLFEAIVREDRSLIDLLDADYTFVDERLARHYGIPNVKGSYFRRVPLAADSPRRGLLGQGSVLTVTSTATRTSPVVRGKWVLENLLGTPAPVPPPGVETNLGGEEGAKTSSVRERLEAHRASPTCASCHKIMDPMGFALENFDLAGQWREFDGPSRIDSKGQLADGTPVSGPADLRRSVLSRSDAFMTTATEKLMTYALGRPVHDYDMPTVRAIVRRAGGEQQPVLVPHHGHHRQRLVPETREEVEAGLQTRLGDTDGIHHENAPVPPDLSARRGRHDGAAAARIDDSRGDAARPDRREAADATRRDLLSARRDHAAVDAGGRGRRIRAHADSSAAQAVLQPDHHRQRSAPCQRLRQRRDGQSQPLGCRVPERRVCRNGRAAVARHHRRSDCRAEDRAGHSPAVARADDRRAQPELRRRPELLVSRHDLVAGSARAAADAEQSAGRLRAAVRRRQHRRAAQDAAGAVDQPAGFGRRRSHGAAAQAAGVGSDAPRSVSERRARDRAARAEGRAAALRRSARAGRADRRAARRRGAHQADVRPAGAGVAGRDHPRVHVPDVQGAERLHVSRRAASATPSTRCHIIPT